MFCKTNRKDVFLFIVAGRYVVIFPIYPSVTRRGDALDKYSVSFFMVRRFITISSTFVTLQ
jgi:hypothetical protein